MDSNDFDAVDEQPPPPDWYDEIAVERAIKGLPIGRRLTEAERHGIARELRRRGANKTTLARVLHCNNRTASALFADVA